MVCTLEDELVVLDYEWCLVFLEGCCIGLSVLYVVLLLSTECLPPFIMAFFSAGGSSCHFVMTRVISIDIPFLLFPRHIFSSFLRQKLLSAILLLLFMFPPYRLHDFGLLFQAPFICNIIIISWEGEDINGVH